MSEPLPPPIYSQTNPDAIPLAQAEEDNAEEPQILILPVGNAVNFQKGFLGVEGERAAIEGELQIKSIHRGLWSKVAMSLRTVETVNDLEVELGSSEIVLYSLVHSTSTLYPSVFPFAIPLMPDTPQSIQTSHSSLSHRLTAVLYPCDTTMPAISRTLTVHTKRYTPHTHTLLINPETYRLDQPTPIEVEVPRTTFKVGESIPIYVVVPPPAREVVVDQGLRLRNIQVELVRIVKVQQDLAEGSDADLPPLQEASEGHRLALDGPSAACLDEHSRPLSSKTTFPPLGMASSHRTVITRSGASCRFHSSRPVKLRFVLHQGLSTGSPSDFQVNLPNGECEYHGNDAEFPSITQFTVLHSVIFRLVVHISFVDVATRSERISMVSIPVSILAPPAPLPEVSREIDVAYQKKHDRPPLKTVRHDEVDHPVPRYSDGEAGPSILPISAPPPFEERDAPPPFWSNEPEASTSTGLPTFLESESEIIIPDINEQLLENPLPSPVITGEGSEFGFLSSEQFDGHTEPLQRESSPPPPTLEMATQDTDLTALADICEPQLAIEALELVLDQHDEIVSRRPPPPPPAMDDPSDPPPSIDSDFRAPDTSRQALAISPPHTSPILRSSFISNEPPRSSTPVSTEPLSTDAYAPPPYLIPGLHNDQENVTRPPPYVD